MDKTDVRNEGALRYAQHGFGMGNRVIRLCICSLAAVLALYGWAAAEPHGFGDAVQAALGSRPGGAVVIRVKDGAVLATANPDTSCRQLHCPGSIFKLVTAFAALQESAVSPTEVFQCTGQKKIADAVLHCTLPNGHGRIGLINAIAQSCNVTFYELSLRVSSDKLLDYARAFGLHRPCAGFSGEQASGILPACPVHPAEAARFGIGQASGFKITLLEAAEMVRQVARGRVQGITDGAGTRSNLEIVRRGMREAVVTGTCRLAALKNVEVAGKTGSPEDTDDPDSRCAWFVGFAPYEKPEIVVVVYLARGHGGASAAPIARRIFASYFGEQ